MSAGWDEEIARAGTTRLLPWQLPWCSVCGHRVAEAHVGARGDGMRCVAACCHGQHARVWVATLTNWAMYQLDPFPGPRGRAP